VEFLVSTQLGTEHFVAAEIAEATAPLGSGVEIIAKPWGLPGFVSCSLDEDGRSATYDNEPLLGMLLGLRSALDVLRYHHHFHLTDVEHKRLGNESANVPLDGHVNDEVACAKIIPDVRMVENKLPAEGLADWASKRGADWAKVSGEDLYRHVKALLEGKFFRIEALETAEGPSKHPISFRVSCNRSGTHSFNSADVEREIGGAVQEYYGAKPEMKKFDLQLRADVLAGWCVLATQCNTKDLSMRHKLVYLNRVTLKCNLAYIMLRAADVQSGHTLLDPFCGSGTVILEAAEWLKGELTGIGLDMNRRAANGASANAKEEGFGECCTFHCSDARALRKVCADESVDAVVTNVPWGVQTGKFTDLESLYEVVFRVCWYVLKPGGRMVLLVLRGFQIMSVLRKLSGRWRSLCFQVVRTTNNLPCIVVVEKLAQDLMRDNLQRQLYDMSHFVNLAPEMYKALHEG